MSRSAVGFSVLSSCLLLLASFLPIELQRTAEIDEDGVQAVQLLDGSESYETEPSPETPEWDTGSEASLHGLPRGVYPYWRWSHEGPSFKVFFHYFSTAPPIRA